VFPGIVLWTSTPCAVAELQLALSAKLGLLAGVRCVPMVAEFFTRGSIAVDANLAEFVFRFGTIAGRQESLLKVARDLLLAGVAGAGVADTTREWRHRAIWRNCPAKAPSLAEPLELGRSSLYLQDFFQGALLLRYDGQQFVAQVRVPMDFDSLRAQVPIALYPAPKLFV